MVAEDCRLSAQHVEDRDHLFSLRGRAHCQTILGQIRPKLKQPRTYSCSVRRCCRRTRPADCSPSAPWQQPGTWQLPPHCSSRCSGGAWSSPRHDQWWLPWGPLRPGEMVKVREVINVIVTRNKEIQSGCSLLPTQLWTFRIRTSRPDKSMRLYSSESGKGEWQIFKDFLFLGKFLEG